MGKVFDWIFAMLLFFWLLGGNSSDTTTNKPPPTQEFNYSQYESISVQTLNDALENNAAAASKNLKNKQVRIVGGKITKIDSDGDHFYIAPQNQEFFYDNKVTCWIKDNSVAQKQLLELSTNQTVDVYGKITRVGDYLGYSVDVYRIELPNQTSSNNPSNVSTKSQKNVAINGLEESRNVLNNFMNAYVRRDLSGMKKYSFYEEHRFTRSQGYDLMIKQIEVWDQTLDILEEYHKYRFQYDWDIMGLQKIDNNTYKTDIIFKIGPDSLYYNNIKVCNINGVWLVDGESFAIASGSATASIFVNY